MANGYQKLSKTVAISRAYIIDGIARLLFPLPPLPMYPHSFLVMHTHLVIVEKLVRFINRSLRCAAWAEAIFN